MNTLGLANHLIEKPPINTILQEDVKSFDPHEFIGILKRSNRFEILNSFDGEVATVTHENNKIDLSRQSLDFDIHTDGAYYKNPPHFLMLHCVHPGNEPIKTYASNTTTAISKIPNRQNVLENLDYYYVDRNNEEHRHPLIQRHFADENLISNFTSKGYVKPSRRSFVSGTNPNISDTVLSVSEFINSLNNSIELEESWKAGRTLIMDNHTYLHGRKNINNKVDELRKLYRIWFSIK